MARGSISKVALKKGFSYRVVVDVGTKPNGKRDQIRRAFPTRKAAEDFLAATLVKVRTQTFVEPSKESLDAYLKRWIEASALRGVRDATLYRYDAIRRCRWGPLAGVRLCDLTAAQIERRMGEEIEAGIAPSTIRVGLIVLRAALDDAVERNELPANPARRVGLPNPQRSPIATWTVAETERVLATVRADPAWSWQATMVYVLLETGMRIGELTALIWDDVDLDGASVRIARTQTSDRNGRLAIGDAKRESSVRDIALSASAVAALRLRLADHQRQRAEHGPEFNPDGLIFPTPNGLMQQRNRIALMLRAIADAAGVPYLSPHGLRHTSATVAVRMGIPIKLVSERLGHASVALTMNLYVHPNSADHAAAADVLGEAFGGPRAGKPAPGPDAATEP